MQTIGTVVSLDELKAQIEVQRIGACTGNCKDCSGCETKKMHITVDAIPELEIGARVRMLSNTNAVLGGYFLVFILPLIIPVSAYLLTWKSGHGGWISLLAVFITFGFVFLLNKSKRFLKKMQPQIIEVISNEKGKEG